jgi:hypothetical protein
LLEQAFQELGDAADAATVCGWLRQPGRDRAGPLPVEVELELTTADPLPDTTLRPRGGRVPRRELVDLAAVERLAGELATYDDRRVFLGGHGDPLQHSRFAEVCRSIRAAGVNGLGIATPLVDLPEPAFNALFEQAVDVVEVQLDAQSAAAYERVHGRNAFGQVLGNIERIERRRREQSIPQPLVVCSLTRHSQTLDEMDGFFDGWIARLGSAVLRGYNEYCGLMPADTLLGTVPPVREGCRRLGSRMMLLADGTVPLCGQDVRGEVRLGNWLSEPITDIWGGASLGAVRGAHTRLDLGALPMCGRCNEWFRV